jgi:hypothetical protein
VVVVVVCWMPSRVVEAVDQVEVVMEEDVVDCWQQYKDVEVVVVEEEMLVAVVVYWLQFRDVELVEDEVVEMQEAEEAS